MAQIMLERKEVDDIINEKNNLSSNNLKVSDDNISKILKNVMIVKHNISKIETITFLDDCIIIDCKIVV